MRSAMVCPSPCAVNRSVVAIAWFDMTFTTPNAAAVTSESNAVAIIISMSVYPRSSRRRAQPSPDATQLTTTTTGPVNFVVAAPVPLTP